MTRRLPHKLQVALNTLDESIRDTRTLLIRPDWRLLGAIGYLWFDIAVLVACFHAAGASLPITSIVLAYQIAYSRTRSRSPAGSVS